MLLSEVSSCCSSWSFDIIWDLSRDCFFKQWVRMIFLLHGIIIVYHRLRPKGYFGIALNNPWRSKVYHLWSVASDRMRVVCGGISLRIVKFYLLFIVSQMKRVISLFFCWVVLIMNKNDISFLFFELVTIKTSLSGLKCVFCFGWSIHRSNFHWFILFFLFEWNLSWFWWRNIQKL